MTFRPRTRISFSGLVVLQIVSLFAVVGCGYRPLYSSSTASSLVREGAVREGSAQGGRAENARPAPTRLAVMAIRNDSSEIWLDRILTEALRREMEARGGLLLVNDPVDAELVLRGRVRPLYIVSRSFSSFVAALEYSVTLQLDLEVVRPSGDVVRLDPTILSETDFYLASADIEATRTHKIEVLRRLSDLLSSRVGDSIELMEQPIRVGEGS